MHKAVPVFTIQHYISHKYIANKFQLLIRLAKTAETIASRPRPRPHNFGLERSRAVSRPRPRYRGLQDWIGEARSRQRRPRQRKRGRR